MTEHTPGAWRLYGNARNHHLAVIDSTPDIDGKVVANCICHVALTNSDYEANAHLIKAAPLLLAACKAFVNADNPDGINLAFVMATSAIKEATPAE